MKKIVIFALACLALWSFAFAQDDICTMEYAPVCGQPPMPVCPPGMACIEMMPAPATYGNDCMRRVADAEFLYTGACEDQTIEPIVCTKEYMPVCGEIQIQCITTPCDPIQETYGNSCMMKAAGADFLYNGACADVDLQSCSSYFDGCNTCSVEDGELGACTLMFCESMQAPRCLQYVSEVKFGDDILLSANALQTIKNVVTRILSPWANLATKSDLYNMFLGAIDQKIADIKYEMMVSRYTPEGYKIVVRKLSILQYVQFLLRNLQAAL